MILHKLNYINYHLNKYIMKSSIQNKKQDVSIKYMQVNKLPFGMNNPNKNNKIDKNNKVDEKQSLQIQEASSTDLNLKQSLKNLNKQKTVTSSLSIVAKIPSNRKQIKQIKQQQEYIINQSKNSHISDKQDDEQQQMDIEIRTKEVESKREDKTTLIESEPEIKDQKEKKTKKFGFLSPRQRHVLVGLVGILIIFLMSYALFQVLTLLKG